MAVRASIATGNFTTAGTWGVVDSTSYLNDETTDCTLSTAYSTSRTDAFTPGAITVSHIGVKLRERIGTTGTMDVHLELDADNSEVSGTLVTINVADLPIAATADLSGGWIVLKLSSPVTLSAATAYQVAARTSSASQVRLHRNTSQSGNFSRALVTTTTGAPASGDDLIVAGEKTGAGTGNTFVVTMDQTVATDYGSASTSLATPSLAISQGGTLSYGTTAATNYVLRQSGNVIVYSGGTLNIGTTGTPIPRDSTAVLEFDCGSAVAFGLTVRNLGTFVGQGLSRTSGKNAVSCRLNTDEAANSTSLGVDTDTGWLDNDQIAISSTTRTASESEAGTLNGNAGASSLTVDGFAGAGGGLAAAHSGTSPTQAFVILLTRNVKIRSVSASFQSFVTFQATATVDVDWVEFYQLGSATTDKRGISINTTTGSLSIAYSSYHTSTVSGSTIDVVNGSGGWTLSYFNEYNVTAMLAVSGGALTTWTIDHCIFMRNSTAGANAFTLNSLRGTFTNSVITSSLSTTAVVTLIDSSNVSAGTISDIEVCNNAGPGITFTGQSFQGTIANLSVWRNTGNGIVFQTVFCPSLTFNTGKIFGNSASGIQYANVASGVTFNDFIIAGDSSFAQVNGLASNATATATLVSIAFNSCTFGVATGIYVAHSTGDIGLNTGVQNYCGIKLNNCVLGSTTEINSAGLARINDQSFISSQKHDQTSGLHKTWKRTGIITIETTTVHTGSQSIKLTPSSATEKLVGPSFYVAVANGSAVTPAIYVYEDGSYNGARARLIVKRNDAIGITSDTVLDTATAASDGAWELLTGTTANATDDGVIEFVVDCDGTAGNLFVDSFSAT